MKLMKWVRNNGQLHLEILIDGKWKHYKDTNYNTSEGFISSNSGFATAQKCLKAGFKYMRVIEVVDFLQHKTVDDLSKEVYDCIVQNQPLELDLSESVEELDLSELKTSLVKSLFKVIDVLRDSFETMKLKNLISFSNGSEFDRCILEDYLVSENIT